MKGPPITIRCECGESAQIPYGECWTCERCGRKWNTAQIPVEEYSSIMREMRRLRFSAIGAALIIGATFAILAFTVAQTFFLLIPVILGGWYMFYMPLWRARVRRRARNLPKWQLTPE